MENGIGNRIASERKRLGLTQTALALKLARTPQNVSNWEVGRYQPRPLELEKMSQLGMDIFFILRGEAVDKALQ